MLSADPLLERKGAHRFVTPCSQPCDQLLAFPDTMTLGEDAIGVYSFRDGRESLRHESDTAIHTGGRERHAEDNAFCRNERVIQGISYVRIARKIPKIGQLE